MKLTEKVVLAILADGEPHARDELTSAAVHAVARYEGIGAYQRLHPPVDGAPDDHDLSRHYVEGAQIAANDTLAGLARRKWIKSVDAELIEGRRRVTSYVILPKGERALSGTNRPGRRRRRETLDIGQTAECSLCGETLAVNDVDTMQMRMMWVARGTETSKQAGGWRRIRTVDKTVHAYAHYGCVPRTPKSTMEDRVLAALDQPLTITELAERTDSTYVWTRRSVLALESQGLVCGVAKKQKAGGGVIYGLTPAGKTRTG